MEENPIAATTIHITFHFHIMSNEIRSTLPSGSTHPQSPSEDHTDISQGHCHDNTVTTASSTARSNHTKRNRRNGAERHHPKRYRRCTAYINIGFVVAMIFYVLIQVFDPTVQTSIQDDVSHHQLNHNPMIQSLQAFAIDRHIDPNHKDQQLHLPQYSNVTRPESDRIIALLTDAGVIKELSDQQMQRLPRWEQVCISVPPNRASAIYSHRR
jgi:hypothetical protein